MSTLLAEPVTMSLQAFLEFSEGQDDGNRYELDEGELITLSPTGYPHGRRIGKIYSCLDRVLDNNVFDIVVGEVGIVMAIDPKPTVRGMDIAVLHRPKKQPKGMLREPPLLIVEVVSPGNTSVDLERKRKQYRDFGVEEVWFVYEETQSIHVYRRAKPEFFICENPSAFQSILGLTIETKDLFS